MMKESMCTLNPNCEDLQKIKIISDKIEKLLIENKSYQEGFTLKEVIEQNLIDEYIPDDLPKICDGFPEKRCFEILKSFNGAEKLLYEDLSQYNKMLQIYIEIHENQNSNENDISFIDLLSGMLVFRPFVQKDDHFNCMSESFQRRLNEQDMKEEIKELRVDHLNELNELKAKDDELKAKGDELKAKDDELKAKGDEIKKLKEELNFFYSQQKCEVTFKEISISNEKAKFQKIDEEVIKEVIINEIPQEMHMTDLSEPTVTKEDCQNSNKSRYKKKRRHVEIDVENDSQKMYLNKPFEEFLKNIDAYEILIKLINSNTYTDVLKNIFEQNNKPHTRNWKDKLNIIKNNLNKYFFVEHLPQKVHGITFYSCRSFINVNNLESDLIAKKAIIIITILHEIGHLLLRMCFIDETIIDVSTQR